MEATEIVRAAVVRLDDERELWFHTYSLGRRRLGGVRVYASSEKYWGPTKSGFDMSLEQLATLIPILAGLSRAVEEGLIVPPVEYARMPAGRTAEWVVQVMEGPASGEDLALDVRKRVTTDTYTGFTRKGLRIEFQWIDDLVANLPAVCESLEAWRDCRWGLFAQEDEVAAASSVETPPETVPEHYRNFF